MTRAPYARYKPSGVEWLGDVPEHWEVKRLKTSATYWVSNVDKVPSDDEEPVRLCNYTDVYYHDHIRPDMGLMETTATSEEIRRFGLRVDDVVITKDSEEWSDIAVPALVVETAPDLVCGYHLATIRSAPEKLLGSFLLRTFQACAVNQQFQVAATGVTRYGLPKSAIGEAWLPIPKPDEQRAIADFLDRETSRLDQLIAKKRELIERLKEKRTALISRTVTRGLPADAAANAGLPVNPPLPAPSPGRFFVYAIECSDGSHYIGQTQDLRKRWKEHVEGRAAEWTAAHPAVRLAHYEEFESREAAVQREKYLRTGFGRKWLKDTIASGRARQAGL
ncbi:MAG TPA: GIY-YIG nuclease family protein, partial [Opitutaceae bacterium]